PARTRGAVELVALRLPQKADWAIVRARDREHVADRRGACRDPLAPLRERHVHRLRPDEAVIERQVASHVPKPADRRREQLRPQTEPVNLIKDVRSGEEAQAFLGISCRVWWYRDTQTA